MNWTETTLGEICEAGEGEVQTGPFGSQLHKSDYRSRGTPVVMPSDIVEGDISTVDVARVGDDMVAKLSSHKLREGDIIFGRRGDIGRCALITERSEGWLCGTGCIRVTPGNSGVDSNFLFYYLSLPSTAKWLENHAVGSTMANLNTSILESVPVQLPPLPIQRRIAEVLSAYDDLIENNKRRIELLEEMAQAVYREWFVEMRFPGHEDASMRDTDALGPVPEGWEIGEMSELLNRHMDTVKPYEEEEETFGYFSFNAHDEGRLPLLEQGDEIKSNKHEVKSNSVLLSKLNPRIPRTWMTFPKGEHRPITSTEFMVLVPKPPVTQTYLYSFLASTQFQRRFKSLASGTSTSHQRVSPRDFLSMPVALPSEDVLECCTDMVAPMLHQGHALRRQNKTLRRTRDFLLPRLVSGEVTVDSMEKEVESTPDIVNA